MSPRPAAASSTACKQRLGQSDLAGVEIRLAQFAFDEIEKVNILGGPVREPA